VRLFILLSPRGSEERGLPWQLSGAKLVNPFHPVYTSRIYNAWMALANLRRARGRSGACGGFSSLDLGVGALAGRAKLRMVLIGLFLGVSGIRACSCPSTGSWRERFPGSPCRPGGDQTCGLTGPLKALGGFRADLPPRSRGPADPAGPATRSEGYSPACASSCPHRGCSCTGPDGDAATNSPSELTATENEPSPHTITKCRLEYWQHESRKII